MFIAPALLKDRAPLGAQCWAHLAQDIALLKELSFFIRTRTMNISLLTERRRFLLPAFSAPSLTVGFPPPAHCVLPTAYCSYRPHSLLLCVTTELNRC